MNNRKRILFVAEAVTLAHVTRLLEFAETLDPQRYQVFFACAAGYQHLHAEAGFERRIIHSIPPQQFADALTRGTPLYDYETLQIYLKEDLKLLEEVRPDLVVGDFRLSLAVSAPLARTTYAAVINAYWSPYYVEKRAPFPEHALADIFGARLAGALFNLVQPIVFARHAKALNRLRRENGLEPLGSLRHAYTHGDYTLYLDVPSLVPTVDAPSNHRYIGPVVRAPSIGLPEWWDSVPQDRTCVYVSFGSSGAVQRLPVVLEGLKRVEGPPFIMVSTAGRAELDVASEHIRTASFIRGSDAARRSRLVIGNGGSTAGYQALAEGVPVLGIPSNMDQYLAQGAIVRAGAGRLIRAGQVTAETVRSTVTEILNIESYYAAARRIAEEFARYDAMKNFRAFVDEVTG